MSDVGIILVYQDEVSVFVNDDEVYLSQKRGSQDAGEDDVVIIHATNLRKVARTLVALAKKLERKG